jgi:hypothetical protein
LQNFPIYGLRIHDAETEWRFENLAQNGCEGAAYLRQLKRDGTIQEISLGMNSPTFILRILELAPATFDAVLMAGCWNLLDQSGYDVLLECQKRNISVDIAGVFGAGILWGGLLLLILRHTTLSLIFFFLLKMPTTITCRRVLQVRQSAAGNCREIPPMAKTVR